jgi:ABC-type sugar transport system permease subunit
VNKGLLSSQRIREWREYLTAYLMIAPATILIFTFGIFPVGFAIFVSLHKWRLKRGDFIGMGNYVSALENLAYILFFLLALGFVYFAFVMVQRIRAQAKEYGDHPGWLVLPGTLFAVTGIALVNWIYKALPEVLDIAQKIIGVEKTRELFIQLLSEAFRVEQVLAVWKIFLWLLLASVVLLVTLSYLGAFKNSRNVGYSFSFSGVVLFVLIGAGLFWVTYQAVAAAYQAALETGEDPGIWPQVITVGAGVMLLLIAWKVWQHAINQVDNRKFVFEVLAVMTLLVGGWLLAGEIPTLIAAGDPDLWDGLKVTVFYSLGTVPFQLTFSLFLAILLFQKLWGSELFRMLYFLPYVTPTVASAAIFRQLFSNRYQAPINQLLIKLGFKPLQ